jgi:hypothetical protein
MPGEKFYRAKYHDSAGFYGRIRSLNVLSTSYMFLPLLFSMPVHGIICCERTSRTGCNRPIRSHPASVYVEPSRFAVVLRAVSGALRTAAPQSKIIFGGMASGPDHTIDYWRKCQAALDGKLPVDALAVHPYGR